MAETVQFKAEVKQLLDLVVNSLYSHKEIFLRELVSNASDAIDKLRYLSITDESLAEGDSDWKIKIIPDAENKRLTISDNGVGMNKDDAVEALGTIAHSGTKEFIKAMQSKEVQENPELIGQFGVGFYSAFMAADKVTVVSRKAGEDKGIRWESNADGTYTIEEAEKPSRGTDVILEMKEDAAEYLEEHRIRSIIKKYSDYIEYPVTMDVEREVPVEGEDEKKETKIEEETLNSMKAVWLRSKDEITEEEYNEFYKHISHDFTDPAEHIHFKLEGTTEFTALLYIPQKAPFDILYKDYKAGPALYVKKVQIMDHCEDLLPLYLRFVKGVVDSSDLPLNISRELLQNNRMVEIIKKNLTKKVLEKLKDMKENDTEKYESFYAEFGPILKEGLHYDFSRKEEIAGLLRFSTTDESGVTDLDSYIQRMKPDQKEIYYISGGRHADLQKSPYLETFKDKGYEVLFMTDEIDDIVIPGLGQYKEKEVKSIVKGDIDLGEDSEKKEEKKKELEGLLGAVKTQLDDKVKDVRLSGRLKESVCCLVGDDNDMDPNMIRIMEAMGQSVPKPKKILEINPDHELFGEMKKLYETDSDSSVISDYSKLLYNLALILEGSQPEDPSVFAGRMSDLMVKELKG
ncbi:molecular chaperone HtpG [Limisalsivibrio acetivorans]|uniref:molecular chaperone HtpG n=1 Tax=Limisalsivibrio acetivorans TaxID=1304888 RepID=UPI0003B34AA6|nr:molecular chaperone HtpG [Limisalsivibrio acetivorans]